MKKYIPKNKEEKGKREKKFNTYLELFKFQFYLLNGFAIGLYSQYDANYPLKNIYIIAILINLVIGYHVIFLILWYKYNIDMFKVIWNKLKKIKKVKK